MSSVGSGDTGLPDSGSGRGDAGLVRALGRWDLVAVAVNGIVGAGIFGLPSLVARDLGPWSPLAYGACAGLIGIVVLCFAEVAGRFERTGGPYEYGRAALGTFVGFQVGWLRWLADVAAVAANLNLLVAYVGPLLVSGPAGEWFRWGVITGTVALVAYLNVRGVRYGAVAVDLFTVAKLLPLLLIGGVGLFFIDPHRWTGAPWPGAAAWSHAVLLLVYAFTGFEDAVIPAGEARQPRRDMPRALLTALGVVTVVYGLVQVVGVGVMPDLAGTDRPLAALGARLLGSVGDLGMTLGAAVSITGNLVGAALAYPRLTYAMARDGLLPGVLARVHPRYRTPHVSVLLHGTAVWGLAVSGTYAGLVLVSAVALAAVYAATCLAVLVLRYRSPAGSGSFRAPGGAVVPVLGTVLSVGLLATGSGREFRVALGAVAVGTVLFGAARLRKGGDGVTRRRSDGVTE